jgi:hypothetical protein
VSTEDLAAWCERWRLDASASEFPAFLDHHRAWRSTFADWAAAWRTWQRNAKRFAPRTDPRRVVQPVDPDAPWLRKLEGF